MASTIALFTPGEYFGYRFVYPRALDFLIGFGSQFQPMITISEYTSLFFSIVLGHGADLRDADSNFFLALMGIVSAGFMWKNFRYAILIDFYRRGHCYAQPRSWEYVRFRGAHGCAVRAEHRCGMGCSSHAAAGPERQTVYIKIPVSTGVDSEVLFGHIEKQKGKKQE